MSSKDTQGDFSILYIIPNFEKDGTVSGAVVVASNLTELKEAEEALRKSEMKFRKLFDMGNNAAILIRASDSIVVAVNDKYINDYGFLRDDIVGQAYQEVFPCKDPEVIFKIIQELSEMENVTDREATLSLRDGTSKDILMSATTIGLESQEHFLVSTQDITELKDAERKVIHSLHEKDVLLKEIHHRVKNNMAVISSLLSLQAGYVDDRKYLDMFNESQARIRSMALVHEQLYKSKDFVHINVKDYVEALVKSLRGSFIDRPECVVKTDIQDINLDMDILVPLGLILSEVFTNSAKHAFDDHDNPTISVSIKKTDEGDIRLSVSDNGAGFPEGFDISKSDGLGVKLINILVRQLEGALEVNSEKGAEYIVVFPATIEYARHLTKDDENTYRRG